jgi:hypothetical protein
MYSLNCCDILDVLYIADGEAARSKTFGSVICFQLGEIEFHQFNIQELIETTNQSTNPLEWTNFVKLCHHRFIEYPHVPT